MKYNKKIDDEFEYHIQTPANTRANSLNTQLSINTAATYENLINKSTSSVEGNSINNRVS